MPTSNCSDGIGPPYNCLKYSQLRPQLTLGVVQHLVPLCTSGGNAQWFYKILKCVYRLLNAVLHSSIGANPLEALLHKPPKEMPKSHCKLLTFIFLAACQTIAHAWRSSTIQWSAIKQRISGTMSEEWMIAILEDKTN